MAEFQHTSVLYGESLEALAVKPDGCYLDGTTGGAGHSSGILERLGPGGRLFCLDRDQDALRAAAERLRQVETEAEWTTVHSTYSQFDEVLGETKADGILLDLGVSSWQLDYEVRGFSYRNDGPLDMRMDQSRGLSAAELLETVDEAQLTRVLRDYGEEQNASRIARAILSWRDAGGALTSTVELAEVIINAQTAKSRREKGHPAKRSFQALRIWVNGELDELETFLAKAPGKLNDNGVLAIISFHSLEDRLVKQSFRKWENPCECPPGLPCVCGAKPLGKAIPRNGILPSELEKKQNPRSQSARLRVFLRQDRVQY